MSVRNYLGNLLSSADRRSREIMHVLAKVVTALFFAKSGFSQDARIQAMLTNFSTDSVLTEVRRLSGDLPVNVAGQVATISSRCYNTPGNAIAYEYLKQRLADFGIETQTHQFSANGENLFGLIKGTIFPQRVCIIGAHYDNIPTGQFAPGADDNASGCAAVLECARLLSTQSFPNTVIFAFWDEEEPGLLGSSAYLANGIYGDSLLGYINLDMIGWDGNGDRLAEIHTRDVASSRMLSEIALAVNDRYDINLQLQIVDPGSINTDHYSFWQNGLTAIGINEEYVGDTYPYYHSVADQVNKLDVSYMADISRLAIATLGELSFNKSPGDNQQALSEAVVYPVPTGDIVKIQFKNAITEPLTVTVLDNSGRPLLEYTDQNTDGLSVSLAQLTSGKYVTIVTGDGFSARFNVVKY